MKKFFALLTILLVLVISAGPALSGDGAAPNSGDGISDGSGMDTQNGPNSDNGEAPLQIAYKEIFRLIDSIRSRQKNRRDM